MNDVPFGIAALPPWQIQIGWDVFAVLVMGTLAFLVWRMVRAYRIRRTLRCPVQEQDADVTIRLDPFSETPAEVTRCLLLHPATDIACSQSCLHPPKELHPQLGA